MRGSVLRSILLRFVAVSSLLFLLFSITAGQGLDSSEVSQLFPKTVGDFRSQNVRPDSFLLKEFPPEDYSIRGGAEATYVSPKGEKLTVAVVRTETQASAYAILSEVSLQIRSAAHGLEVTKTGDIGIAGIKTADRVAFYKGTTFVSVNGTTRGDERSLRAFARAYAQTLESTENEIPVLVKHLPDWETAQDRATYAVSRSALQRAVGNQAALDVVSFDEGTEAVTADYEGARLVVVEYMTPQLAESNDARILERIGQLRESRQPVPSSYRRIGNYSVFVFNAPDEGMAARLADQIKYEQKIQWLGQNPLIWEYASRQHTQKAVSLILGIARTIGFFVALCLGAGGIVGGLAFLHRRAQQRRLTADAYSDAGGMLRLNLDEMTAQTDPSRLLGSGEGKSVAQ
jgi:hypothetical protein